MIYVIADAGGYQNCRLCKDGKLRWTALFGSYPSCVKQYRSLGHAKRRAKQIGGEVVQIPKGFEMDCSGLVIQRIPAEDKPGYERVLHHNLTSFVVH